MSLFRSQSTCRRSCLGPDLARWKVAVSSRLRLPSQARARAGGVKVHTWTPETDVKSSQSQHGLMTRSCFCYPMGVYLGLKKRPKVFRLGKIWEKRLRNGSGSEVGRTRRRQLVFTPCLSEEQRGNLSAFTRGRKMN